MNAIKAKREQANMTQAELAKKLYVTQGAVSQWETGATNPSFDLLFKIAAIFGCSAEELYKEKTPDQTDVEGGLV